MQLTWADLLIEGVSDEYSAAWLQKWRGVIEGRVALVFLNKFGFWFLRRPAGPVDMLDVFTGKVERVATKYDEFVAEVNDPSWQEVYLLSKHVYALHKANKIPGPSECYALAPHPAHGGPNLVVGDAVDTRSVMIMAIGVWQSLCAQAVGGSTKL